MKTNAKKNIALLLRTAMILSIASCANPRGSYVEAGGAGAGISAGKVTVAETDSEQAAPITPLPKDYKVTETAFSTKTADDLHDMFDLARRIVDECDTLSFKTVLTRGDDCFDIAYAAQKASQPFAYSAIYQLYGGRYLSGTDRDGWVTLKLSDFKKTASDKEFDMMKVVALFALLDQHIDSYVYGESEKDKYYLNHNLQSILVCSEYREHGYESLGAYLTAIYDGSEENHGDVYRIDLQSGYVSSTDGTFVDAMVRVTGLIYPDGKQV